MNGVEFIQKLEGYSHGVNIDHHIGNELVEIRMQLYRNPKIFDTINKFVLYTQHAGKANKLIDRKFIRIAFALMSDFIVIKSIYGIENKVDYYHPYMKEFFIISPICQNNRFVKLKHFSFCQNLLIIDCKIPSKSEVYEVYNVGQLEEFYESNKVPFDDLKRDLGLVPTCKFDLFNIENYYILMSIDNELTLNAQIETRSKILDTGLKHSKKLSGQITDAWIELKNN